MFVISGFLKIANSAEYRLGGQFARGIDSILRETYFHIRVKKLVCILMEICRDAPAALSCLEELYRVWRSPNTIKPLKTKYGSSFVEFGALQTRGGLLKS